jgi:hypothetical protein
MSYIVGLYAGLPLAISKWRPYRHKATGKRSEQIILRRSTNGMNKGF